MPNLAISLRSWTFSRGRSFLLDFFCSITPIAHLQKVIYENKITTPAKQIKKKRLFFNYDVIIIQYKIANTKIKYDDIQTQ